MHARRRTPVTRSHRTGGSRRSTRTSAQRTTGRGVSKPPTVPAAFGAAFTESPAKAQTFAKSILKSKQPIVTRATDADALVHWASTSTNPQHRRTLVKAFIQVDAQLLLVHQMAGLPREQTAAFVKDYFAAGGKMDPIMQWLRIAGGVMRRRAEGAPRRASSRRASRGSRGLFDTIGDWVSGAAESVGDAIVDAVDSLVDAVVSAGKSVADAVAEAASWTVDELTDLAEALIKAGKSVTSILNAAYAKSEALLKKYVEALLDAGRTMAELLQWAATKAAAAASAVVAKLLALGRTVLQVLKAVATAGASIVRPIVKALLAIGKSVATIIAAVSAEALATLKPIIDALLAAGQSLRTVLAEAAKQAAASCRTIVRALLDLGQTLTSLLVEAATAVAGTLQAIIDAVLDLGRTLAQVLAAIAGAAASVVKAVLQSLLALGKSLAEIVIAAVGQSVAVAIAAFKALLSLGKSTASILFVLAGRAVSALRTAVEALLTMGIALADIVEDIVLAIPEAFRRGFFEGLVQLGKTPLLLLKAAAEVSAAVALLAFAVIIELFGGHRSLTANERKEAERIFGASIDLDRVLIAVASMPADLLNYINGSRPFTTMYIINFASGATVDVATLIHELTHVWQGVQTGPLYMVRALEAQIGAGLKAKFHSGKYDDAAAYEVTNAELKANKNDFSKFNPEQQAIIVERYWVRRFGTTPAGDVSLLEPYAKQVFTPITRGVRGAARWKPARLVARSRAHAMA